MRLGMEPVGAIQSNFELFRGKWQAWNSTRPMSARGRRAAPKRCAKLISRGQFVLTCAALLCQAAAVVACRELQARIESHSRRGSMGSISISGVDVSAAAAKRGSATLPGQGDWHTAARLPSF